MRTSARAAFALGGIAILIATGCGSENPSTDDTESTTTSGGQTGIGADGSVSETGGDSGTGGSADASSGGFVALGDGDGDGGSTSDGGSESGTGGVEGGGGATPGAGGDSAASGGASGGGDTTCGTSDEDASVRLSCPEGQRIESVLFASYGNPTGACGSFVEGTCHAEPSQSAVEELCIGRAACTVPANNSLFTDPCNSTVKSLAVEVECVVGEVTVDPIPYKGIANSPAGEISELGASWCYNWTTGPQSSDCADPLFVPMIWGGGNVASALAGIAAAGYDTVLGFNEPNKSDQANMTVADAIAQWPALTSDPNIRVGSPAVSDDGRAWLEDFMDQVQQKGLRVDFVAMHWYGWNAGSCTSGNLQGAINWAAQWGLPVWITEFGCMGSSNTDEATLIKFFNDSMSMLENHPEVERYAWYPWNDYNHLYLPDDNEVRQRTALGDAFLDAAPYR